MKFISLLCFTSVALTSCAPANTYSLARSEETKTFAVSGTTSDDSVKFISGYAVVSRLNGNLGIRDRIQKICIQLEVDNPEGMTVIRDSDADYQIFDRQGTLHKHSAVDGEIINFCYLNGNLQLLRNAKQEFQAAGYNGQGFIKWVSSKIPVNIDIKVESVPE